MRTSMAYRLYGSVRKASLIIKGDTVTLLEKRGRVDLTQGIEVTITIDGTN